jgi:hypothetical protein
MQAGKQFGTMIGVVIDRRDPQNLGRVRVRYPTLGIESGWARVLVPYGGASGADQQGAPGGADGGAPRGRRGGARAAVGGSAHGFKSIPEEGDEVIVGFIEGDPKLPLILGSTYSERNPPPMRRDIDVRVLQSPGGHRITLADTPPGGKITLESGDVRLGGANALQPAVLGNALNRLLTQLLNQLALHTHGSAAGPTTPPVNAVAFTGQISGLASLLSQIVKIER